MNRKQCAVLSVFVLLASLDILFPPRLWKIDEGVALDVTYNLGYGPVRYSGEYLHRCQSATDAEGVFHALLMLQSIVLFFVTWVAFFLVADYRRLKGLA